MVQRRVIQAEGNDTGGLVGYENSVGQVKEHNADRLMIRPRSQAGLRSQRKRTHATGMHPLSPAVLCQSVRGEQNTPSRDRNRTLCFGVLATACDFSQRAECVPDFRCESEHEPLPAVAR